MGPLIDILSPIIANCHAAEIILGAGIFLIYRQVSGIKGEIAVIKKHVTNHLEHSIADLGERISAIEGYIKGKHHE